MTLRLFLPLVAAVLLAAAHDVAAKSPRVVNRAKVIEVAGTSDATPRTVAAPSTLSPQAAAPSQPPAAAQPTGLSTAVPALAPSEVLSAAAPETPSPLERFYRARGGTLAWLDPTGEPRRRARTVIGVLARADREGLDPTDYDAEGLAAALRERCTGPGVMELDRRITESVLRYAHDLAAGRVKPSRAGINAERTNQGIDVGQLVERSLARGAVRAELAGLAPRHVEYTRLREALPRYRELARAGVWPRVVDAGAKLEPGKRYAPDVIESLQERLRAEGFLEGIAVRAGSVDYDAELAAGVRRFQAERGMAVDGVVGRNTLAELNRPASEIVAAIEANMERWRWLPRDFAPRHIRADIPSFELRAFDPTREPLAMRIIAGQRDWSTPLFSDQIDYVVLNPSWHVPKRIAAEEIFPRMIEDPSYLIRNEIDLVATDGRGVVDPFEVQTASIGTADFPYRLRQRPGPRNPLGRVKFVLPNRFDIYLHDTNNTWLFKGRNRALSHGCVRVEHPVDLATWVLSGEPKWTHDDIVHAIGTKARRTITLSQPVPVYLTYVTASVGDDGRLRMQPDVYGFDAKIAGALSHSASVDVTASAAE